MIFIMNATGGMSRPLLGTGEGLGTLLSPDGRTVAFARVRSRERVVERPGEVREHVDFNVSIWTVGLDGSSPHRLTPLGFGVEYFPSSFSPDGSVLVATRSLGRGPPALVGLELDGSGVHLIARHAAAGVLSPDGTRIAYLHQGHKYEERDDTGGRATGRATDLFVSGVDGSHSLQLTHTPKRVESGPSWDPSGERLAFAELGRIRAFETSKIVQINADGSCRTKVLSLQRAILNNPVWQPGPGREAGRIPC
jgi:Tol biopolymer transport system component